MIFVIFLLGGLFWETEKLKEILNDKNKNVKQIASETGIRPTTLYSIIQKTQIYV